MYESGLGRVAIMGSKDSSPARSNEKFVELDTIRMANGTKGIISQRLSNGVITFSIVRTFERDGVEDWTSYFSETQISDFEEMLKMVKARIKDLRADPKTAPLRVSGVR